VKIKFDRRAVKICVLVFLTAAAVLVFNKVLNASENLLHTLYIGWQTVSAVLSPFVIAVAVAYILNPAVNAVEKPLKFIWRTKKGAGLRHTLAVITVYVLVLGVVAVLCYFTIPQTVSNLIDMAQEIPNYYRWAQQKLDDLGRWTNETPILQSAQIATMLEEYIADTQSKLLGALQSMLSGLAGAIGSAIGTVINIVLGAVLSFYLLNERDAMGASARRLCIARLGEKRTNTVYSVLRDADNVFGRYISSKLLEAVVIYAIAQVVLALMGVKFNVLFSVFIAFTNMVPYIGPVVGAIPPILVTLVSDPLKALYVGIAITVLQMADAYVIAPVLTGNKTGISPFWVMVATLVGGNLFGLPGMLLAVPVCGLVALFIRRYVSHRLQTMEDHAMQAGKSAQSQSVAADE